MFAVLTAAGSSSRMESEQPKVLMSFAGRTVLEHSLQALIDSADFERVALVCPSDLKLPAAVENAPRVVRVEGGATRQDSVRFGLEAIAATGVAPSSEKLVAIHDAARFLVSPRAIRRVIERAEETGAASLALPVRDSVRRREGGDELGEIVDRESLLLVQTPQVFRFGLILEEHRRAKSENRAVTDDTSLLAGRHPVSWVQGELENIKLTFPEDLEFCRQIIATRMAN